ncbi:Hemolysin, chromosomal [Prochlorococcus marinus str. MIT 1313]|uniref:calcium-binding protein n=1 Tax=Prochlorococcus TaxID=1218 RepID=UPI0007C11B1D|nr:calcium-binding protein [Prochlorococcus marinus]KZR70577.1 Hemolysin, chromosomal [Prochlorococcus marinus str. MIT 1313]
MPFSSPTKAIGSYGLIGGTTGNDSLYASGTQAAFGGDGSDILLFGYRKYSNGYWLVPFLVGGAGNDLYTVFDTDVGLIADLDGGYDKIRLQTRINDVVFAWVNGKHILGYDTIYGTTIIFIDPFGRESQDNKIEMWQFYDGTFSAESLENRANSGSGLLGYTSWQALDDSGYLKFSIAGLIPSLVDYYLANAAYNSSIVGIPGPSNSNDTLSGDSGPNTISALYGDDTIDSGAGNDILYGNQGNDRITAGSGADYLYGGQGGDILYGNQGADKLYGNFQDDVLYGGQDNDWQHGGQGADWLYGNFGIDEMYGGRDNDLLHGGQGNDKLWGNHGADKFFLSKGQDQVMDFNAAEGDLISLQAGTAYSLVQQGTNLLVDAALGDLLLVNISINSFNAATSIVFG